MKQNKDESIVDPLQIKMDTIIKLLLYNNFSDESNNLKIGETAKFLYSCGWKPIEIAKFLGKKKASDITYILYSKKKK